MKSDRGEKEIILLPILRGLSPYLRRLTDEMEQATAGFNLGIAKLIPYAKPSDIYLDQCSRLRVCI